jgi:alpha-1,2-mannosyltransferase
VALLAVNAALLVLLLAPILNSRPGIGVYRVDLDVYRIGSWVWLAGGDLYGRLPNVLSGANLPFTYPPFAAIVLSPFGMVPYWLASLVITVLSLGLVAAVSIMVLRSCEIRPQRAWLLLVLPAALVLEPVRANLDNGQINILLMAMVAADCLGPRSRHRGLLLGIAAAIKLTPAAFILFLVFQRDWRAALRAGAAFLAATGLAFLFAPHDSVVYWTGVVADTGRIGGVEYSSNQSIMGALARLNVPQPLRGELWLALVIVVLVVAAFGIQRALAAGRPALALAVNGVAELLASPVSWSHHWVWAVPLVLTLAVIAVRERARWARILAVVSGLVFAVSPQWWFPHLQHREQLWSWWQQLVGDAYIWLGFGVLVTVALVAHQSTRRVGQVADVTR